VAFEYPKCAQRAPPLSAYLAKKQFPTRGNCAGLSAPAQGTAALCGVSSLESGFGVPSIRGLRNGWTVAQRRNRSPRCDYIPSKNINGMRYVADGWNNRLLESHPPPGRDQAEGEGEITVWP
jgi:hypothetical protein